MLSKLGRRILRLLQVHIGGQGFCRHFRGAAFSNTECFSHCFPGALNCLSGGDVPFDRETACKMQFSQLRDGIAADCTIGINS